MHTRAAAATIRRLLDGERLRAASFIVTVYGDVVEPRGGLLWMGSLVEVCALAGISETRVRTAVSRLVAAGRLEGTRVGRRSFYRLTPAAGAEFGAAAQRIFAPPPAPGGWLVVLDPDGEAEAALLARGFAPLGPGVLLGPERGEPPAEGAVLRAGLVRGQAALRRLAGERWRLDRHAAAYADFLARFSPLRDPAAVPAAEAQATLLARLLLVHAFREIALADPGLPAQALPDDWPADAARALFAELYIRLSAAADSHVAGRFLGLDGPLPAETDATRRRLALVGRARR